MWQLPWPSVVELLGRAVVELDGLVTMPVVRHRPPRRSPERVDDLGAVDDEPQRVDAVHRADVLEQPLPQAWHAASTAPPLIHVWRDADVEPDEPIGGVDGLEDDDLDAEHRAGDLLGDRDESWPTSDVANFSVATPSARRHRAVE